MLQKRIEEVLREVLIQQGAEGAGFIVEPPPPAFYEKADLATNAALVAAKGMGLSPLKLAERLCGELTESPEIEEAAASGGGFINILLSQDFLHEALKEAVKQKEKFGWKSEIPRPSGGKGVDEKMLLEFVSANPTGPLNVVSARAAAFGDALTEILKSQGARAEKEYYVNDTGQQAELLGKSVEARIAELEGKPLEIPPEGYAGEYLREIAQEIASQKISASLEVDRDSSREIHPREEIQRRTIEHILDQQKRDLVEYGVSFDRWFHESSLLTERRVEEVLKKLKEKGHAYEKDGALWLASTKWKDDKDRVLLREDGRPTYLASDLAYHADKFRRGYDNLIDIWGPDHHGYTTRTRAGIMALGLDAERLEILIVQQVHLKADGKRISMSKRGGAFVTLNDLIHEVGKDAARFFFLMRSASVPLEFDLTLAKKQAPENPVYYVQYAHARLSSILREARARGAETSENSLAHLTAHQERRLMCEIGFFPDILALAARERAPHLIAQYLLKAAGLLHRYYQDHRVISEDSALTSGRLYLCAGLQSVFKSGLALLGVSCPEKM